MQVGRNAKKIGVTPSILLVDPKYARNVSMVRRVAACYGVTQVWHTGQRLEYEYGKKGKLRLPREERMKGYAEVDLVDGVDLINYDRPFDQFIDANPIAVEVLENSENLYDFEFPSNPIFVFGPEDGTLDPVVRRHCHRFVHVPVRHCLNLATVAAIVLDNWQFKQYLKGKVILTNPGEFEKRGAYDSTMHV